MTVQKLFISVGTLILSISLSAQDTLKFTVSEAQDHALNYNRSLKTAKIDIEIAKKVVWETTTIGLPQFTLTANYQHIFVVPELSFPTVGLTQTALVPTSPLSSLTQESPSYLNGLNMYTLSSPGIPLGTKNNTTFNFTVSQLIFSGEYIVGLQAARIFKEVSEKAYIKSELTTKESVAGTYYMVIVLKENLKVLNEGAEIMNKTYHEIEQMNLQGFVENTDVDQMKINQSNLQNLIESMTGQYEVSLKLLKIQLGIDFAQALELTDDLNSIINSDNLEYFVPEDYILRSSIDYKILENQVELQRASLHRAQSSYLPSLAGFYQHQELTNAPAFNFMPKDVIGINLSLPIFTSGQRMSKVSQGKLNLEKAKINKEMAGQSLMLEYETARNNFKTAYLNYTNNKESLTLSENIYNKNIIKFKEGLASSLELTQSQSQYLEAESNYYNSIITFLQAKAKMDRILSTN